jgi:hypothetical protein
MSLNKINKEFKKLYRLYKNTDISRENKIFSDSKGFSLRDVLNDRLKQKITVIAKSGANIYNNAHYYKVKNAVKKAKNPVVIVWLGTCDITEKKGVIFCLSLSFNTSLREKPLLSLNIIVSRDMSVFLYSL